MNFLHPPRCSGTNASSLMCISLMGFFTLTGCQPTPQTGNYADSNAKGRDLQEWNPYAARLPLEPILYVKR